ncbi:hypothetical protein EZV76_04885 [Flagellimonas alvinocaridis]|uniref:Uncharacterized protein n=1 Tax=Flagellimonas alvinocaridis TaxID=2530200 RepID=A0A4S8RUD2_9FLAO|nr:hypothetical protein [Allomuricauda alvinocaridis]THV61672.1 hypothetical protein EZV76_04885 [Allomuricauda alvinocaridis]
MSNTLVQPVWYEDAQLLRTDIDEESILTKQIDDLYSGYGLIDHGSKGFLSEQEAPSLYESSKGFIVSQELGYLRKIPRYNYYKDPSTITNDYLKMKGFVTSIEEDSFKGRLFSDDGTYELVEFEKDSVSEEDLPLFKEGAIFYWIFGLFTIRKQRKKVSEIRFQRIAPLNPNEFDSLMDKADKLNEAIDWD